MKIMITTDSEIHRIRLQAIFSGISRLDIAGQAKDLDETLNLLPIINPDVLILSQHRLDKSIFNDLKEVKKYKKELLVIVLSGNDSNEYTTLWKQAGADYVFDQAFHFNRVVDVLSDLLFDRKYESLKPR